MKKLLFALSFVGLCFFTTENVSAQTPVEKGANIEFEQNVYDYGTIKQYSDGSCHFIFTNTGNEPLIISSARGSCGCTVPTWPKAPIPPGETGKIKVHYDTKRIGRFGKTVTLQSNAVNSPTVTLRIKGEVLANPNGTAPVNNEGPTK